MTPTLSAIVPIAGRASLRRTLESAAPQMLPGDEVIVVGDTTDGPLPETEAICRDFPFVRYVECPSGEHNWGHEQTDHGLTLARGDWLLCNDDDDIWTPGAFEAIRGAIAYAEVPRPLLFRFKSHYGDGFVFWHTPSPEWIRPGHIGGHCLVQPNVPGKVGMRLKHGTYRYESDFDQIANTLALWRPVEPLWCDFIICEARPK